MKANKKIILKYQSFLLLLLTMLLTVACGTKIIRGASPMVRMNELSHQDNKITLVLSMRNPNGVELNVETIDFSLSVKDDDLFAYKGAVATNIVANGTEIWTVEVEESDSSRLLLESLQSGDVKSLPYQLKGSVFSQQDGTLLFAHEGHIYPMPGRPGYFR